MRDMSLKNALTLLKRFATEVTFEPYYSDVWVRDRDVIRTRLSENNEWEYTRDGNTWESYEATHKKVRYESSRTYKAKVGGNEVCFSVGNSR